VRRRWTDSYLTRDFFAMLRHLWRSLCSRPGPSPTIPEPGE